MCPTDRVVYPHAMQLIMSHVHHASCTKQLPCTDTFSSKYLAPSRLVRGGYGTLRHGRNHLMQLHGNGMSAAVRRSCLETPPLQQCKSPLQRLGWHSTKGSNWAPTASTLRIRCTAARVARHRAGGIVASKTISTSAHMAQGHLQSIHNC